MSEDGSTDVTGRKYVHSIRTFNLYRRREITHREFGFVYTRRCGDASSACASSSMEPFVRRKSHVDSPGSRAAAPASSGAVLWRASAVRVWDLKWKYETVRHKAAVNPKHFVDVVVVAFVGNIFWIMNFNWRWLPAPKFTKRLTLTRTQSHTLMHHRADLIKRDWDEKPEKAASEMFCSITLSFLASGVHRVC